MSNIIDKPLTCGLELEISAYSSTAQRIIRSNGWERHYDASVLLDDGRPVHTVDNELGGEITTTPQLVTVNCTQDGNNFQLGHSQYQLNDRVADLINCSAAGGVNRSCGLHLHIGRPSKDDNFRSEWEPERVRAWLAICCGLEPSIFGVVPEHRRQNEYCSKIGTHFTMSELRSYYPTGTVRARKSENPKRRCWINLIETRRQSPTSPSLHNGPALGTVEIRLFGGPETRYIPYTQAWVNFWLHVGGLCAYVPSTLAIMHCLFSNSLKDELHSLKNLLVRATTFAEEEEAQKLGRRPSRGCSRLADAETPVEPQGRTRRRAPVDATTLQPQENQTPSDWVINYDSSVSPTVSPRRP